MRTAASLFKFLVVCVTATASFGCATGQLEQPKPTCSTPAPIEGRADARAPGIFVVFKEEVGDPTTEANMLASRHGYKVVSVFVRSRMIVADGVSPRALAALRCEMTVQSLFYNGMTGGTAR